MDAIPRVYVDRFTQAINGLSAASREGLRRALLAIDMTQPVAVVRDQTIAAMDVWCGGLTDQIAVLAAEFYDGLRELEVGTRIGAVANSGRNRDATEGAVRAFAQKLVDGKPEQFVELCLERLDYEGKVAASQTVLNNARRDRFKPRFARVPTGTETCDFCLMLASRGFVYHTEAAESHAHSGCDCRTVPSWRAEAVEGYDPDALYDQWQESVDQTAAARAERNGTTEAEERRNIIAAYERSAANARKRRRN